MKKEAINLNGIVIAQPHGRVMALLMLLGPLFGLASYMIGFDISLLLKISMSNLTFFMIALFIAPNLKIWINE